MDKKQRSSAEGVVITTHDDGTAEAFIDALKRERKENQNEQTEEDIE